MIFLCSFVRPPLVGVPTSRIPARPQGPALPQIQAAFGLHSTAVARRSGSTSAEAYAVNPQTCATTSRWPPPAKRRSSMAAPDFKFTEQPTQSPEASSSAFLLRDFLADAFEALALSQRSPFALRFSQKISPAFSPNVGFESASAGSFTPAAASASTRRSGV